MAEKKLSEVRTFSQELKPMKLSQAAVSKETDLPSVNVSDGASRSLLSAPSATMGAFASPRLGCAIGGDESARYPRHIPVPLFERSRYAYSNAFSQLPKMPINLAGD